MIYRHQAIQLVRQFIEEVLSTEEWYKSVKSHVKALLLYGSVTKGTNTEESDIDVLLILPLKVEKKYAKGEYFYNYNGYTINIVLRSIERLRKISKEDNDNFQKEIFRDSVIVEVKDNEIERLLDRMR